jgi:hypothetical protein
VRRATKINLYQSQQKLRQASVNLITNKMKIKVRNCSKIPSEVQQVLAKRIVNYLIRQDPEKIYKFVCIYFCLLHSNFSGWRFGGSAPLSCISKDILTTADRSILSRQDKGIQTFLRNHYQVFFVEKAVVSIRFWPTCNFTMKTGKTKHRACWFFQHHPDGFVTFTN